MKRLILMRHAKSDWSRDGLADHDRPLNPRGRRASTALGNWLRRSESVPDVALVSSSARTRETCLRLDLSREMDVVEMPTLYLAEPTTILHILRQTEGECVLVIGHNPGIGSAANAVLDTPSTHPQFAKFPTGATLIAGFAVNSWSKVDWGGAKEVQFIVPRDLEGKVD